jgi:hypothetical protein
MSNKGPEYLLVEAAGGKAAVPLADVLRIEQMPVARVEYVGIAVSHVLDVAIGAELYEAGTTLRTHGVTLLKECVTGIVNLGGIADLVNEDADSPQWSPDAEAVQ